MSDESNKQAVLTMHEAISRGDIEGMFAPMTDDVTFRVTGDHPLGQRVYQGKQDIINNLLMKIFSRLDGMVEVEVLNIAAENEKVFLHFKGNAKTVSGDDYNNEYVQLFSFQGGKISSVVEFLDTALLAKVVG